MKAENINPAGTRDLVFIKGVSRPGNIGVSLKVGDFVQAKVVASSQSNVILNIGGSRIMASTSLSLHVGDLISLTVVELSAEKVVFRQLREPDQGAVYTKYTVQDLVDYLLNESGLQGTSLKNVAEAIKEAHVDIAESFAELDRALYLAGANDADAGSLNSLRVALDEVVVKEGDTQSILSSLKALVRAISHEANLVAHLEDAALDLRDLKLSLLSVRSMLESRVQMQTSRDISSIKTSIEKIINALNTVETLNLPVDPQQGNFIYLPLPVRLGNEFRTAEIKIFSKNSGNRVKTRDGSVFNIAFSLDMPALGKTRAWLEMVDKTISFSIAIENRKGKRQAEALLPELRNSFEELGYRVAKQAVVDFKQESPKSLVEEKMGVKLEGVDFKA